MASASSLLCEEQLLCSICLCAFTEPVSTPCGHNYCKSCITGYWATSNVAQCPLCKKKFRRRPQLQVNTEFRDMVEHFNNMRVRGADESLAQQGEVPCDVCLGLKLKAQKTCLVCLASYCQSHLEPHQRVPALKKHKLIDPVSNLEDRVCKKHDKMFEFFCRTDQMCVCFLCLKDDHAMHETVPLEHVVRERKTWIETLMSEIKTMEITKSVSVKRIQYSLEQRKKESDKEIADVVEVFTALVASLQRGQAELIEVIKEKQKAAVKTAEDHMAQLELEVTELKRRRSEIEQLLQTEDHLHLLQSWPSLCFPAHTEYLHNPLSHSTNPFTQDGSDMSRQSCVGMVKKAVAKIEKTLNNEMETLIQEVKFSDGCEAAEQTDVAGKQTTDKFIKEVWNPPQDKLMMIQLYDEVDVTMDAYTANARLTVSEDGKQLRLNEGNQLSPSLFARRFEHQSFVLGKDGFSSGRFYYEVQVSQSTHWVLGVVKESINKQTFLFPNPEEGGWTFSGIRSLFEQHYFPNTGNPLADPVYLSQRPQTVGVFVDYEKGEVSFYDVDTRTLIYSFTGCTFFETAPALKTLLYTLAGTSLSNRPKLYPIFGLFGDHDDSLIITPVGHTD
ncbi:E3 ubiquitin-protein ligase TRIM39-like isoform X2 [Thunnus maccoyii]|nr:E3 ubiquitin-protein ligase TRIM39-like isoform X2 [Thunnus maccoyii]XP_042258905.1 E3 ubiquitin-protein ligase TRIM39-like isoform X2 [Thunnus maccoyii]